MRNSPKKLNKIILKLKNIFEPIIFYFGLKKIKIIKKSYLKKFKFFYLVGHNGAHTTRHLPKIFFVFSGIGQVQRKAAIAAAHLHVMIFTPIMIRRNDSKLILSFIKEFGERVLKIRKYIIFH